MNRKQRRTAAKINGKDSRRAAADNVVQKAIEAARAGALIEAASAIDDVLKAVPDHVEALHQKGVLLARTAQAEEGVKLLRRVTAAKPNEALYWNNLAAACLSCRQLAEAVDAAGHAVRLDPKYAMVWTN